MKKILNIYIIIGLACFMTGCFEDYSEKHLFTDLRVEFQDAVIRNNSPGLTYPLVGTLRNNAGLVTYQVNMFGGLSPVDQIIRVRVLESESSAIEGSHYLLPKGLEINIPANEAFGFLEIEIPELSNVAAVRVVFELESNNQVHASANHKTIGIDIRR